MSVKVIKEDENGRNIKFKDTVRGTEMTRSQFVNAIKKNENAYQDNYHIRVINGVATPVSNPNGKTSDNLG